MAVTTTGQDILDAAYAKSLKNRPGEIATAGTELLKLVVRSMHGLYAYAARVNPIFFAETASVAFASPGWARPALAESVIRIENGTAEVVVVPYNQRDAEPGKPAVWRFGQIYRPASAGGLDPQGGSLTFFYAKRPTTPASLAATLDALWTEQFNELLVLEVAIYLALKDGRGEEVPGLTADRDRWVTMFTAFLEHETAQERRSYGHVHRFTGPSLVPLVSLLAGGSSAAAA